MFSFSVLDPRSDPADSESTTTCSWVTSVRRPRRPFCARRPRLLPGWGAPAAIITAALVLHAALLPTTKLCLWVLGNTHEVVVALVAVHFIIIILVFFFVGRS